MKFFGEGKRGIMEKELEQNKFNDLISRQAAIDMIRLYREDEVVDLDELESSIAMMPSTQPTLYGYNIGHLELIARILQKEDLSPERVADVLLDIGRIVAIVRDEFEETLRKTVEQCTI